jgi:transcriptional regulator with XRE-family HTH domain
MTTTPSDLVAAQIQAARQSRGWSAKDLALRCAALGANQLTAAVIANIETGRRNTSGHRRRDVTVDELLVIALALDVPPLELLQPSDQAMTVAVTPEVLASQSDLGPWLKGEGTTVLPTLLRGLALCGSCRTPVTVHTSSHGLVYFCANQSCASPVIDCPVDFLDSLISRAVLDCLQEPDAIEALFPDREIGSDVESLDSQVAEIKNKVDELIERRAAAVHELETLADHPGLSARIVARSISSFSDRIIELEHALAKRMEQIALERQRMLLERHEGMLEVGWENSLTFWDRRTVIDILMNVVIGRTLWGDPPFELLSKDDVVVEWKGKEEASS